MRTIKPGKAGVTSITADGEIELLFLCLWYKKSLSHQTVLVSGGTGFNSLPLFTYGNITSLIFSTSHLCKMLSPTATRVPSLFNPIVWSLPAEIETISSQDDTLH